MESNIFINAFLQVQTIGPEGNKLVWVFLVLVVILLFVLLIRMKKWNIKFPKFSAALSVSVHKNKIYHPTVIQLKVKNRSGKAIVINHPVIRFKKIRQTKAFKIKSVNTSAIYPLYLEANKTHELAVALKPFFDYDQKLKRYARLRIEFGYDGSKFKNTRYLLLMPTLFSKAKS